MSHPWFPQPKYLYRRSVMHAPVPASLGSHYVGVFQHGYALPPHIAVEPSPVNGLGAAPQGAHYSMVYGGFGAVPTGPGGKICVQRKDITNLVVAIIDKFPGEGSTGTAVKTAAKLGINALVIEFESNIGSLISAVGSGKDAVVRLIGSTIQAKAPGIAILLATFGIAALMKELNFAVTASWDDLVRFAGGFEYCPPEVVAPPPPPPPQITAGTTPTPTSVQIDQPDRSVADWCQSEREHINAMYDQGQLSVEEYNARIDEASNRCAAMVQEQQAPLKMHHYVTMEASAAGAMLRQRTAGPAATLANTPFGQKDRFLIESIQQYQQRCESWGGHYSKNGGIKCSCPPPKFVDSRGACVLKAGDPVPAAPGVGRGMGGMVMIGAAALAALLLLR